MLWLAFFGLWLGLSILVALLIGGMAAKTHKHEPTPDFLEWEDEIQLDEAS